jgi:hypothetical protein
VVINQWLPTVLQSTAQGLGRAGAHLHIW